MILPPGAVKTPIIGSMITSEPEYPADREPKFLGTYARTGSVTRAAKAAKVSLAAHYRKLQADAAYRKAFEAAREQVVDLLEAEAFRRALAGSDELLLFLLRAWSPAEYGEHVIHEHTGSINLSDIATSAARGAVRRLIPISGKQVQ